VGGIGAEAIETCGIQRYADHIPNSGFVFDNQYVLGHHDACFPRIFNNGDILTATILHFSDKRSAKAVYAMILPAFFTPPTLLTRYEAILAA
jgi:hypothetical protein